LERFHPDSYKTCVSRDADQEYIHFIRSEESSSLHFLTKIIIPSVRV